jgi:hypothetical protein
MGVGIADFHNKNLVLLTRSVFFWCPYFLHICKGGAHQAQQAQSDGCFFQKMLGAS